MKSIYFDNAATTKVDNEVLKAMLPYFTEKYGNASSVHFIGQEAKRALEDSRKTIAKSIGAKTQEIYFTSGGTEANNLAIKGLFYANYPNKNHFIISKIEHDCVLNACKWLETQGAKVTVLDVDANGFVNPDDIEKAITDKTILVSIIHGNNEIGTIQDLEAIGKLCRSRGIYFHTDACQSYTKTSLDVGKQNLDLVTLNSHKIHGPKGVGALYIKEGIKIVPLMHGGGHERKMRSGTENVSGIVGFAKAVDIANRKNVEKMTLLRDKIIEGILKIQNTKLNGPRLHNLSEVQPKQFFGNKLLRENRLCNNVNVSFNNIEGESIGGYLENYGICTSTGSACASHSLEISHVLRAIGLTPLEANSSIRLSISKYTTEEEVDYFLELLPKIVEKLRKLSPLR